MRKLFILFLLLPLLLVAVFIVWFYVPAYVSAYKEKEKTYYFPQIETYMKVYKPQFNNYGYVIFSKDSVFSFSENIDFVKIYKSETSWVSFIFNPAENNKFYIVDETNNAQINQVNFAVEKISGEDTTFFKAYIVPETSGTRAYKVKPPYINITVEGYLQKVFLANDSTEYLKKISPIK